MPVLATISPTQSDAQAALGTFLLDLFPGVNIVVANDNRVPEPQAGTFIVMSPIRFERQATNVDSTADVRFTGSIAGNVLTVSAVTIGQITGGLQVLGPGVAANTRIGPQMSGPTGGPGTYEVSVSQTLGSTVLSAGSIQMTTTFFLTIQLDFHSAKLADASAQAQTFVIAFRDAYATTFFSGLPAPQNGLTPLYADDAAMRPFYNDQKQFEWRWVVDAKLQIDQTVTVPQTYADSADVVLYEVP